MQNLRLTMKRRPSNKPVPDDFALEDAALPELRPGEFSVRHDYIDLQPATRIRMSNLPSYAEQVPIGGVPPARTVGRVIASRNPAFAAGDVVVSDGGWQTASISDGTGAEVLDRRIRTPRQALGCLGPSGMTAYVGILDHGKITAGETVVVSAAAGAVGAVVGQIARLKGCRVVGIAGGNVKCAHVVEKLGFHACVDYQSPDFAARLDKACPDGIDVDFENVGGAVRDKVWQRMNNFSRVVLCGLISEYDGDTPSLGPSWHHALIRRITVRGFLLRDHLDRRDAFLNDMTDWIDASAITYPEHVVSGITNLAPAFIDMLSGRTLGKTLVRVGEDGS